MAFPKTSVVTSHEGTIFDAQFDYYGKRFATCGADGKVKVFMLTEDQPAQISEINYHQASVLSLSWSHPQFGSLLATGGGDRKIAIWKETAQNKWTLIYEYEEHLAPIASLCWSPHEFGLILLAGSADGCISLISLVDDRWEASKLMAHEGGVSSVFWSPASTRSILDISEVHKSFVTGGADGLVKVWKWEEENLVFEVLEKHKGWIRDVAWLPYKPFYGHRIVSAGDDGNIMLWSVVDGDWVCKVILSLKVAALKVSWNEGDLLGVCSADFITRIIRENIDEEWEVVAEAGEAGEFQEGHIN